MKLAETCVKYPVFTVMLIAFLVTLGAFSYRGLAVDLFPKADPAADHHQARPAIRPHPHLAGERANEPPGADGNRRQTGAAGDPDRRRRRQRGAEWRTSPADPHIARCPETYRAQFYRAGRARRPA